MTLRTEYDFTLPRGYVDSAGGVHRRGTMRLATARDELEPLRNPTISGPDDPRLTILILARVVTKLGDVPMVTSNEIEELFAADLAFLQDFYGVINFGTQQEFDEFIAAQEASPAVAGSTAGGGLESGPTDGTGDAADAGADADRENDDTDAAESATTLASTPNVRTTVQRMPSKKGSTAESSSG